MSVFSKVSKFARNLVGAKASAGISSGANKILTAITRPIQSITNFKKAEEKTAKASTLDLVVRGVQNTLVAVAPFTSGGRALVGAAAKKLVTGSPLAIAGKVGGAAALTGAALSSEKIRSGIAGFIPASVEAGQKIGKVIEGELPFSDITSKDAAKIGTALTGAGIGGLIAAGGMYAYDKFKETQATANTQLPTDTGLTTGNVGSIINTNPQSPITRQTQTISSGSTQRRKKKKKEVPTNNINIKIDDRDIYSSNGKIYKGRGR